MSVAHPPSDVMHQFKSYCWHLQNLQDTGNISKISSQSDGDLPERWAPGLISKLVHVEVLAMIVPIQLYKNCIEIKTNYALKAEIWVLCKESAICVVHWGYFNDSSQYNQQLSTFWNNHQKLFYFKYLINNHQKLFYFNHLINTHQKLFYFNHRIKSVNKFTPFWSKISENS